MSVALKSDVSFDAQCILCNSKAFYTNLTFYKIPPPPPPQGPGNDFLTGGADKQQQQQQKSSFPSRCADAELTSKKRRGEKRPSPASGGAAGVLISKLLCFQHICYRFGGSSKILGGAVIPIFSGGQHPWLPGSCPPPPPSDLNEDHMHVPICSGQKALFGQLSQEDFPQKVQQRGHFIPIS